MPAIIPGVAYGGGAPAYIGAMKLCRRARSTSMQTGAANSAYPVTNLDDYLHPVRKWKASSAADQRIVLDLGGIQQIGAIYIGWADSGGGTIAIQGHATSSWGAPTLNWSVPLVDALNPLTSRYNYAYVPDLGTMRSFGYVAVFFSGCSTPPSLGQFEVLNESGLLLAQRTPLKYGRAQGSMELALQSGGRERIVLGPRRMTVNFDWEYAYNYQDYTSGLPETALLENPNLHTDVDDSVLIVRDIRLLPNFSAICVDVGGGALIESAAGIGANLSLAYEEVMA